MPSSKEPAISRTQTDRNLRAERERSDDELLARSTELAEDAEEVIERARERARRVLELARDREDGQLLASEASPDAREIVQQERRVADATLSAERATADAQRLDERERRRAAMIQLLAFERSATDRTLAAERQLADRSVTAREDLLGVVAHDLRNMLQTVVVNASAIVIAREAAKAVGAAALIQRVGAQMAQLLEDLLDFSSFEAGKLTLAMADVDLLAVVADAMAIHEEVAKALFIAFTMQADATSVLIRGDARRLTRLLMNVIGNAFKFTPADGSVRVSVSVIGTECEIAVSDSGVGIPHDQLQSIFERFQQVGTQPRRSSGVGLGLYIARLIAEAHGGRIWAESELSAGSTFRIRLPMAGASSCGEARRPSAG